MVPGFGVHLCAGLTPTACFEASVFEEQRRFWECGTYKLPLIAATSSATLGDFLRRSF